MIDMHCHILPALDDGAKDMDTAMHMAKIAEEDGTSTIIATPHFWYGNYENSFQTVSEKVQEMNNSLQSLGINVIVLPGQEVFFDNHTVELYKGGSIRGINSSRFLLLELPMDRIPKGIFEGIYELQLLGAEIILAHPERYMYVINKPSAINEFAEQGCLFQINSGSITGIFGSAIRETAETLIKHNMCDFIASDAHTEGTRCPGLNCAYKLIKNELKQVLIKNGQKLMENMSFDKHSEKIKERSFFSFFKKE